MATSRRDCLNISLNISKVSATRRTITSLLICVLGSQFIYILLLYFIIFIYTLVEVKNIFTCRIVKFLFHFPTAA